MKKRLQLGIILSLMACLLLGCEKKDPRGLSPENPQTITIWHYYNGTQELEFADLVTEFNDTVGAEKGIIAYAESKSSINDLSSALYDSAQKKVGADKMPDLFQCYLDVAVTLDDLGVLGSFDPYLTQEEKDEYMDSYIQEGIWGTSSELKLFPFAKSTEVMMLNKTDWEVFSKATGVSTEDLKTWEGLTRVAEKYYDWSNGEAFFGRDAFANYMVIGAKQLGTPFFASGENGVTVQADKGVCKRLWECFYVPYVKGYYSHVGRFRTDDIKLGKIIAQVCSTTSASYFPEEVSREDGSSYPIDYLILPVPNFEGTQPVAVQQGANMAISKQDERVEYACTLFLKWFTEKNRNMGFAIRSGYLPVRKDANTVEAVNEYFEQENLELSGIERDTMLTAYEQLQKSEVYTSPGFLGGEKNRNILDKSMLEKAVKDAKAVSARIESGELRECVLEEYLSEENFEKWYETLMLELK